MHSVFNVKAQVGNCNQEEALGTSRHFSVIVKPSLRFVESSNLMEPYNFVEEENELRVLNMKPKY